MYTFSFIMGNIIPKRVKCIHSATKPNPSRGAVRSAKDPPAQKRAEWQVHIADDLNGLCRVIMGFKGP